MIKRKTAECIECGLYRFIYAKKMCGYCYQKQRKKSPLLPPKKQIAKFSKKQLSNLREYRKVRDAYMKENPICQYPKCESKSSDLHHSKGRIGSLLTEVKYFKALCRAHHQHIEENPALAYKLGLSYSRLIN